MREKIVLYLDEGGNIYTKEQDGLIIGAFPYTGSVEKLKDVIDEKKISLIQDMISQGYTAEELVQLKRAGII